jgi:chromate reductase, NAD(P)H dehydrogenase (quinone)
LIVFVCSLALPRMITVVIATNRPDSMSEVIATKYLDILRSKGEDAQLLSMRDLPADFIVSDLYGKRSEAFAAILSTYVENVSKFVFIIPEYNGSYPGILKVFFDAAHPRYFREKKAGIIGVSDGHAGNLRGQEHLTGVLHYMKMFVHFSQPKLSDIDHAINDQLEVSDERTLRLLNEHADQMIKF